MLMIITLIYAVSFLPTMLNGKTLSAIYQDHLRMVHFRYRESFTHPYLSQPWSWPLVIRPIWYHFEQDAQKITRGIIAMGAPLFWWTFLIFLPQSLLQAIKYRNRYIIFMLTAYGSQ